MATWRQGQDIDVLLPAGQLARASDLLLGLAAKHGGIVVNINAYRGRRHVMVALRESEREEATLVEFDLQTYVVEGDVLLAGADELVDFTESLDSICRLEPAVDAVFRILRGVLRRGAIKESDWQFIRRVVANDRCAFQTHLGRIIGLEMAGEVIEWVTTDVMTDLLAARPRLVRARLRVAPGARFREKKIVWRRLWRRVLGTIRPPGEFICLVGTDGAGKTTAGQKIAAFLAAVPYPVKYEYCGVGGGVPKPSNVEDASPRARSQRPVSRLKQLLRPRGRMRRIWVPLCVGFGLQRELWHYIVDIRPTLAKGGVVVGDRYYYDTIANLYEDLPPWFIRLVTRLFPGPTLVVHLYNEPSIIYRRKQERTPAEIELAILRLRRLRYFVPDWRELLTDHTAPEIAWRLLADLMQIRTKRQLAESPD